LTSKINRSSVDGRHKLLSRAEYGNLHRSPDLWRTVLHGGGETGSEGTGGQGGQHRTDLRNGHLRSAGEVLELSLAETFEVPGK